jgi:TonB family protein
MTAYIIKSSVSLLLMFGLYWFILRKEKLFVFNRFFLVASVVFSLVVPFISIPVNFQVTPQLNDIIPAYDYLIPDINTAENTVPGDVNISQTYVGKETSVINISAILLSLYISGVILFLIRFMRNIYIIMRRRKLSERISFKGYQIVLTNDKTGPYCFFSNIFLNKNDYKNGKIDKELLDHELEHAMQAHSFDIILIELVKIFYWFNPLHVLYERAIRINHEYLADNGVIDDNSDIKGYADKLLGFITGRSNMSLTSGSDNSYTKMRLLMMMKPGSRRFSYGARIVMTICIGTVIFLLLCFKESDKQPLQSNLSGIEAEVNQSIVRGIVLNEEGKPLKEATIVCMISEHASSGMTVGSDGRFAINNVKADNSLIIGCFGYKTQIIKPDFTSEMIIKLTKELNSPEIKNVNFRNSDLTPANALVAINGVILDYKGTLRVNPGEIELIKILMDKEATDKYGDKGKDGVLEIVLYGNQPGSTGKKRAIGAASDTSKYITLLSVNHISNKGELINIPVSNLQSAGIWTYHDNPAKNKKELRTIGIMTRDYYTVKGTVVQENGKPLAAVAISVSEEPVRATSDKEGRFLIEDVRENALLEFSLPGFKPYYINTSFVPFNMELNIELKKEGTQDMDEVYETAEKMPQYPGGEMELRKFIAKNVNYPENAKTQKAKGVVIVRFVVNTTGNIEDVEILQKVHPALDAEVLRVVGMLDRFIPGSQGGKPINVYYTLPITFGLPESSPLFSRNSESDILRFLGRNTKYPQEAKASSDTGRIYVVVKLEKGGSIKECKAFTDKVGIQVPFLPEVVIVGYKSSVEPGELRPGKTTGKTTGNNLTALQTECVRVANKLSVNEIPDWKDNNIEFAVTFIFALK